MPSGRSGIKHFPSPERTPKLAIWRRFTVKINLFSKKTLFWCQKAMYAAYCYIELGKSQVEIACTTTPPLGENSHYSRGNQMSRWMSPYGVQIARKRKHKEYKNEVPETPDRRPERSQEVLCRRLPGNFHYVAEVLECQHQLPLRTY